VSENQELTRMLPMSCLSNSWTDVSLEVQGCLHNAQTINVP